MGELTLLDCEMGAEESVQLFYRGFADVKDQELFWRLSAEVLQHFAVMLIPILKPALFELAAVMDPFFLQGIQVGLREAPLVVLQA